jgi:hypothetical protein
VQIDNAYVPNAHRAFVHRSHSGRYGMVNSEEGYQNLRRFLFGDLEVRVELHDRRVRGDEDDDIVWQLETQMSIRGLPIVMHEQTTAHHCPVQIEWRAPADTVDTPVPLLTTFLATSQRPMDVHTGEQVPSVRHALRLRLISIRERGGIFGFFDHLEQTADFDDTLVVDFLPPGENGGGGTAWATWNSQLPGAIRDWKPGDAPPIEDMAPEVGVWRGRIPLPESGRSILGSDATIVLTVSGR